MRKKRSSAVPVVMYHSVGRVIPDWQWSFLTVPWKIFENHLHWLRKCGFQSVDLNELNAHVSGITKLPARSVVLTFDDGYLDNWTYAAPLLKKYGFSGTLYVNAEFVDPRDVIRPTLVDVWNKKEKEENLEIRGFMSWPELRLAEKHGVLDVQSHAMSHTWYEVSDKIVDYCHPGSRHYWLEWNSNPLEKPYYLQSNDFAQIKPGTPIYETGKSLGVRRFYPDKRETEHLQRYVQENGGDTFFINENWSTILLQEVKLFRKNHTIHTSIESDTEYLQRIRYEICESKKIIEKQLGKTVDYFCWPGGGYKEEVKEIALQNYKAVTLSSADTTEHFNRVGDEPSFLRRFGAPYIEKNNSIFYMTGNYLIQQLEEFRNVPLRRQYRQLLKLIEMLKLILKMRKY